MLGYIYRSVNQSLVDTEKLLKLLNEPTDINDKPDATDLIVEDGEIEFGMFINLSLHRHSMYLLVIIQTMSLSRTMVARPLSTAFPSRFQSAPLSLLLANPVLENPQSCVSCTGSMT